MAESDCCGEAAEPGEDPFAQAGEGSCAAALEDEEVCARPEDRLDPLADRREMRLDSALVFAARAGECRVTVADGRREPAAGVSLVAEQGIAAVALAAVQQNQAALALIELGEHSSSARGVPSGLKIACNRNPQKYRECEPHPP